MQNPQPHTAKELSDILDARNDIRGIKRLEDVLPDLSTSQVVLRAPNASCMRGFSARRTAIGIVEAHNED